ncbi:Lysine-specific demethylase ELF6 [Linum perenne]
MLVEIMGNVEIPKWLQGLPLAPEFRPTDTEFADPIAYISKIEKEASAFGICKIVPPLPKPSKKYVFSNLNKTLAKSPELGDSCSSLKSGSGDGVKDGDMRAVFTTRHQELGQSIKKKGVEKETPQMVFHKQVWQSGEVYTLEQFESKSKAFAKSVLGSVKEVSPLVIEALFWKAAFEKPIYVEYANDVPGSAFGEPEGQFRYFHHRRRRRASYQSYRRHGEGYNCQNNEMAAVDQTIADKVVDASIKNNPSPFSPSTSATTVLPGCVRSHNRKGESSSCDVEGTAGWKLSNSPWNLQMIARSPGSLTRYMPDDIPGVTSPMVYIGMLYSWFAWHVEDHELHSMNFLHIGSPKTWYSVPGDYAFAFEDVIRRQAYGGKVDRLASLSRLGEKTTLLSPEVLVSSGIPCCRLIQNPGEFVVTFPRAYHVGFSHGFNCGEAANFSTPQWLEVAKEAAVRRAAMNYLPMLSHQQLLYLLTMSFVLRVPRSLLPGARSSRLRDRQKEERELSVKRAFIEDLIRENNTSRAILRNNPGCKAVIWNPDLLPRARKQSQLIDVTRAAATRMEENLYHTQLEHNNNTESTSNLFTEMSKYVESLNDLYADGGDISCDFQVDSGSLVCIACGILGFPFMSVVQPFEKASKELLHVDNALISDGKTTFRRVHSYADRNVDPQHVPEPCPPLKDLQVPSGWDISNKFLRPRVFCLEHGLQIRELLQSRGGANMLVICHSDFQKMKAYATSIAEDINVHFDYNEVPLESALTEDLNLIDLAIDRHDWDGRAEDWTSKRGVNLLHCVKIRKKSPSTRVHHALTLAGLFLDGSPSSEFSTLKWKSKRSRTRNKLKHSVSFSGGKCVPKKDDMLEKFSDGVAKKEEKLLCYTRRKFKTKGDCSINGDPDQLNLNLQTSKVCQSTSCNNNVSINSLEDLGVGLDGISVNLNEVQFLETTAARTVNVNLEPLVDATCSVVTSDPAAFSNSEMQNDTDAAVESSEHEHNSNVATANVLLVICKEDRTENAITCDRASKRQLKLQADRDVVVSETSDIANSPSAKAELVAAETSCTKPDACDHVTLQREQQEDPQNIPSNNYGISSNETVTTETNTSLGEACEELQDISLVADGVQQPIERKCCDWEEPKVQSGDEPNMGPLDGSGSSESVMEQIDVLVTTQELASSSTSQMDDHPFPKTAETCYEPCVTSSIDEDSSAFRDLNGKVEPVNSSLDGMAGLVKDSNQESIGIAKGELDSGIGTNINLPESLETRKASGMDEESLAAGSSFEEDKFCPPRGQESIESASSGSIDIKVRKRRREVDQLTEDNLNLKSFVRSPCEGLRPRRMWKDDPSTSEADVENLVVEDAVAKRSRSKRDSNEPAIQLKKKQGTKRPHKCEIEGCGMRFQTKEDLVLHSRNRCPYEGCRKKFSSHRYALIHQRVHDDDRPLKCPWKGCKMAFKWAWARTEHIRVHTGEKPYHCKVDGCGLSFRFVSDFSRHRRKTGHHVNSPPD